MPLPLHKQARGLLELLNLKVQGRGPSTFGEEVAPTYETRPHYQLDNVLGGGSAPGTTGGLLNLQDSVIFTSDIGLVSVGAQLTLGAAGATDVYISLSVNPRGNTQEIPIGGINISGARAAGSLLFFGVPLTAILGLPAGSQIVARSAGASAGADHLLQVMAVYENWSGNLA